MNATSGEEPLGVLFQAMGALQRSFKATGGRGFFIGGVAVSLVGRPRMTRDVDGIVLLEEVPVEAYLGSALEEGIVPRIEGILAFFQETKVLPLKHSASGVDIDVSAGLLPFEREAFGNSAVVRVGQESFRVPAPEDLVVLKAVARRPKDYEDIRGIAQAHPGLDRSRIQRWVQEFSELLEAPEVWTDLLKVLDERP